MRRIRCKAFHFPLLVLLATLLVAGWSTSALAVPVQTAAPIAGEIEGITITNIADHWSGGTMTIGGQVIIVPANLLINLPNDYQTLQELYLNAPAACAASGIGGTRETGLAKIDKCNARATGAQATILANRTLAGNVIAGQVDIFKALESVNGDITYIDPTQGYFRINGTPGSTTTGVMIRVNDPTSRHTIQTGLGCPAGALNTNNCSADVRFKVDPDNYTFCYITGYPACIPGPGINPANCLDANRPVVLPTPLLTATAPVVAADSRHFAPIKLGDNIKADGNFETIGGVTFFSAASVRVFVDLTTRTTDAIGNPDPTQPDYLIISEAGWDGPAYPASRVRGRYVTMASQRTPPTDIDYLSVHYDQANTAHEQILYTTQFNTQQGAVIVNAGTGVYDSQIRYSFFPPGKPDGQAPCVALRNGVAFDSKKFTGTPVFPASYFPAGFNITNYCTSITPGDTADIISDFKLMAPLFREVMARSTRQQVTGLNKAIDIHGNPSQSGQYKLPVSIEYGAFEDINLGMTQFPVQFSGNPFLLDRRLSPNGCFGACEGTQQPLTPFPFEGINPDAIVANFGFTGSTLPVANRMFAFMDATGKMTGTLAWPPPDLGTNQTVVTPTLNMFPPFADEDDAVTTVGLPVTIAVLANDIAPFGTIDPASVKIPTFVSPFILGTLPSGATVQVNPAGTITYTPAPLFSGLDTFTYTVANNFGSVSLPGTVNVNVRKAPTAVNDTASVPASSSITISLTANDIAGTSPISLASINIVSPPTCGTVLNNHDGDVLFTAPATIPPSGSCVFSYVEGDTNIPPILSNVATVTVTITPTPPVTPATGATLSMLPQSNQPVGSSIAAIASGSGGTGTYEYEFWLNNGIAWSKKQAYSTSNSWVWDTTGLAPGVYTLQVNVRSAGSSASFEAFGTAVFQLTAANVIPPPATGATLAVSPASPQGVGTSVIFTGGGVGGSGTYEYEFWRYDGVAWTKVQSFSLVNSFVWNTTAASAGVYTVQVNVRSAGSTASFEGFQAINYTLTAASAATGVTIVPNKTSPQLTTTPGGVTFTATGQGGTGSYEYEFWLNNGTGWSKVQNMSTNSAWIWNTALATAGTYTLQVNVRSIGSTAPLEAFQSTTFQLQ